MMFKILRCFSTPSPLSEFNLLHFICIVRIPWNPSLPLDSDIINGCSLSISSGAKMGSGVPFSGRSAMYLLIKTTYFWISEQPKICYWTSDRLSSLKMENREKAGVGQYPRLGVPINVHAHTFVNSFIMRCSILFWNIWNNSCLINLS